ncbi:MAG TPA: VOC family protein [Ktedonobacterales bacterium]|nr:VOC family protein [Ktedonobacterales bacterium]
MAEYTTRIGHAHLKVRDLDRSIAFYTRFLHMREQERVDDAYAFLTGGDLHHEIALQNVGPNAPSPSAHGTGLYHVAFEVPTQRDFAAAYRDLTGANVPVAAVDHLISWAMYFDDPDGNGLEIYWDTRREPGGAALWHGINRPLPPETIRAVLEQSR